MLVDIDCVLLLPFNFSNISVLTLYGEMFKLMIDMLEAMFYGNDCKSYNYFVNVKHCVEARK